MVFTDLLEDIIEVLEKDGTMLYPTDTIWGLGCDMNSEIAYEQIYRIKKRERSKPLILLVDSIEMLKKYIRGIHPRVETLLTLHKKPLTIIYKANENIPRFALPENRTIAIRVVNDTFCQTVIKALDRPLVSTSANLAGEPFPKSLDEVDPVILEKVDYAVKLYNHRKMSDTPSVLARFDYKGQLHFIR